MTTRSASLRRMGQRFAEPAVALQMPLAAHGFAPRRIALDIDERPGSPAGRTRAFTGIVRGKTPLEIERPSDIGPGCGLAGTAEHIHEAFHRAVFSGANRGLIPWHRSIGQAAHAVGS